MLTVGGMVERWDPWAALRRRPLIELRWGILEGCTGLIEDLGGGWRRLWLDTRIGRVERRCTLAHELVHDERGIFSNAVVPAGLIVKEERAVDREVAARLVPLDQLVTLVRMRVEIGPVSPWTVAEEFDVTHAVAERAMARLRHPSMGPPPNAPIAA